MLLLEVCCKICQSLFCGWYLLPLSTTMFKNPALPKNLHAENDEVYQCEGVGAGWCYHLDLSQGHDYVLDLHLIWTEHHLIHCFSFFFQHGDWCVPICLFEVLNELRICACDGVLQRADVTAIDCLDNERSYGVGHLHTNFRNPLLLLEDVVVGCSCCGIGWRSNSRVWGDDKRYSCWSYLVFCCLHPESQMAITTRHCVIGFDRCQDCKDLALDVDGGFARWISPDERQIQVD